MDSIDDLIALLRDDMGLSLTAEDAKRPLDEIAGWDSVHLLWLVTLLERQTGRSLPMAAVLEAGSVQDIYDLAVRA